MIVVVDAESVLGRFLEVVVGSSRMGVGTNMPGLHVTGRESTTTVMSVHRSRTGEAQRRTGRHGRALLLLPDLYHLHHHQVAASFPDVQ